MPAAAVDALGPASNGKGSAMAAIWQVAKDDNQAYPALDGDIETDVLVIGAGITGLTTALQVAEAGKRVAVLEALRVGGGTTGASTGNLYAPVTKGLSTLRKKWGDTVIAQVAASRTEAVDYIEETARRLGIDCAFHRRPLYRVLTDDDPTLNNSLDEELDALLCVGLAASLVSETPLPFPIHRGLKLDNQAQFDPLRYVQGLARELGRLGVGLYEYSSVLDIDFDHCRAETATGKVSAESIVLATHTPKGINLLQTGMEPLREYGIAARLSGQDYPQGIFWVLDPFHSIRSYQHAGQDYLIMIGEQHKTGEGKPGVDYYGRMESYLRSKFPVASVDYRWSAQQYGSADGLPYIGRRHGSERVFLATGFAGDGLTWGTVAGRLLGDLVLGHDSRWSELYDATRFTPVKSMKEWVKENTAVARHLAQDYLTPTEAKALDDVPVGEGRIVALEGEKLAVYRNELGQVSAVSAVCPHLKCLVHWNPGDRTWDCPCHGSRFEIDGSVIEGPAYHPLARRLSSE